MSEESVEDTIDDIACEKCNSGENASELLLYDGCTRGFHLPCLIPALPQVPTGDWFSDDCASDNPTWLEQLQRVEKYLIVCEM